MTDTDDATGAASINDGQDLEIADPNDFFHRRDGDDELQPVKQRVPGRDQALRVIPPSTGDYRKYKLENDEILEDGNEDLLAELFNEKLPDLDFEVTATDIEQGMIIFGAEPLLDCIKRAGGQDMKDALEQRKVDQMMDMMGGEGNLDIEALIEASKSLDTEDSN